MAALNDLKVKSKLAWLVTAFVLGFITFGAFTRLTSSSLILDELARRTTT